MQNQSHPITIYGSPELWVAAGTKKKIYLHRTGTQRGVLGQVKAGGAGLGSLPPSLSPSPCAGSATCERPRHPRAASSLRKGAGSSSTTGGERQRGQRCPHPKSLFLGSPHPGGVTSPRSPGRTGLFWGGFFLGCCRSLRREGGSRVGRGSSVAVAKIPHPTKRGPGSDAGVRRF